MSEQEVRDGLAALVVDEPPLVFDPDALMAKADAATRRRRTLVGASSATVVIAAAAVALPITLRGPGGNSNAQVTPGSVSTTTVATKPAFVWPPASIHTPSYSVEQVEQVAHDLQDEAGRAFPQAVPGATDVRVELFAGEAEGDYSAGQLSLNGAVHFATEQGKAAVDIQVSAGAINPSPSKTCADDGDPNCKISYRADGSAIVVSHWSQDKLRAVTVLHFRPDGVVVAVSGYNTDNFLPQLTPYLAKIPVSEQQLTALATDEALTM